MFDIGFSEIAVIAIVALLVMGPKRLPVATRTLGALLGRAQRYVNDVKSDIQRQMDLEQLRKVQEEVKNVGDQIQSGVQSVEKEVSGVTSDVTAGVSSATGDLWEGSGDTGSPAASVARFGTHIRLPELSWTEQNSQRRIRERLRGRMRRRFMTKVAKD